MDKIKELTKQWNETIKALEKELEKSPTTEQRIAISTKITTLKICIDELNS